MDTICNGDKSLSPLIETLTFIETSIRPSILKDGDKSLYPLIETSIRTSILKDD
jgi:hypothetical protein